MTADLPAVHVPSVLHHAQTAGTGISILDVFDSLPWFKPTSSWVAWRAFLAAVYALPMTDEELSIYRAATGRQEAPTRECTTVASICGRRAGKTRIDSTIIGYEACYRDYTPYLGAGERAYFPIISADKRGARQATGYIKAFLASIALEGLVSEDQIERPTAHNATLHFTDAPVTIEIFTASYRTTRGYAIPAFLADEIAFWSTASDAADPDTEIVKAVQGGMVQIPGAKTLLLSSPHGEQGYLWQMYDRYYGADKEDLANSHRALVWQAETTVMNPSPQVAVAVAEAYDIDEVAASAEYGAVFRQSEVGYVGRDVLRACTSEETSRAAVLPTWKGAVGYRYHAFMDPASGSGGDSLTLAVAHWDKLTGQAVQDLIYEARPPFDPHKEVQAVCKLVREYGCTYVTGDAWGDWPREIFGTHGLSYVTSDKPKAEIYKAFIPAINAGLAFFLCHARQEAQFLGLRRRPGDRGREIIDHQKGGHDDCSNSVAGAMLLAYEEGQFLAPPEPPEPTAVDTTELRRREYRDMVKVASEKEPDLEDEWAK